MKLNLINIVWEESIKCNEFWSHFSHPFPAWYTNTFWLLKRKKIKRGKSQSLKKLENSSKHCEFKHQQPELRSYPQY